MPPSTPAFLQTYYTGLNAVLALAYNIPATEHYQEDFVQQRKETDVSPADIRSDYRR